MNVEQDPGRAKALNLLAGPAIALMITAGLGILAQLFSVARHLLGTMAMPFLASDLGPAGRVLQLMTGPIGLAVALVALAIGVVVLVGALKMKAGRSYGFALAATILAMVPCVSPCCCLGLPFGIWALVVLLKPEVKAAFLP
jgi:hypothetical protein